MVGASGSCLARAFLVRRERAAWLLIGAGLLIWTGPAGKSDTSRSRRIGPDPGPV